MSLFFSIYFHGSCHPTTQYEIPKSLLMKSLLLDYFSVSFYMKWNSLSITEILTGAKRLLRSFASGVSLPYPDPDNQIDNQVIHHYQLMSCAAIMWSGKKLACRVLLYSHCSELILVLTLFQAKLSTSSLVFNINITQVLHISGWC